MKKGEERLAIITSISSRDSTSGIYGFLLALGTSLNSLKSRFNMCLKKNKSALNDWFWVEAATFLSTAKYVKNFFTLNFPAAVDLYFWKNFGIA